ncbi:hypothetical protein [Bremerella cremea]|uniref:hypothetical protein n=1 Tax=Bremerella cremea TaxID=1031537 RepID=UPI0031ED4135
MKTLTASLLAIALLASATPAYAHFPWLTIQKDGKVAYFFGENPADCTYKLPGPIAKSEVSAVSESGKLTAVELEAIESDDFVGRQSAKPLAKDALLQSQATFGIYHGSRLDYYTQHVGGKLPASREAAQKVSATIDLKAELVKTEEGVDAYILWQGKPLADADVHLYCEEGHEEATAKTDQDGKVSFTDAQIEEGVNGIMVGHTLQQAGTLNDKKYDSNSHYLTVTFQGPAEGK